MLYEKLLHCTISQIEFWTFWMKQYSVHFFIAITDLLFSFYAFFRVREKEGKGENGGNKNARSSVSSTFWTDGFSLFLGNLLSKIIECLLLCCTLYNLVYIFSTGKNFKTKQTISLFVRFKIKVFTLQSYIVKKWNTQQGLLNKHLRGDQKNWSHKNALMINFCKNDRG